jgi:hypothetical protein
MKHLALKLGALFGLVGLGLWRHERRSVRLTEYPRQRVNREVDEVLALSEPYEPPTFAGSVTELKRTTA